MLLPCTTVLAEKRTLWVNQQGLGRHSRKYTQEYKACNGLFFFLTTLYCISNMITLNSAEFVFYYQHGCLRLDSTLNMGAFICLRPLASQERSLYITVELHQFLDHWHDPLVFVGLLELEATPLLSSVNLSRTGHESLRACLTLCKMQWLSLRGDRMSLLVCTRAFPLAKGEEKQNIKEKHILISQEYSSLILLHLI